MTTLNSTTSNASTTSPTDLEIKASDLGVSVGDLETFRPYNSALPVPTLKGYRTVKCLYKKNARTGKTLADNSYIRVADHITEDVVISKVVALAPSIVGYLQAEEDKLIRSYHIDGATTVAANDLTVEAVIEAIEASTVSQRLNKDKIEEWFSSELEASLNIAFSEKLEIADIDTASSEELCQLERVLGAYKSKFVGLASGKTHYREDEVKMLQIALDITGARDTFIGGRFSARLDKMLEKDADTMMLSLG